MLSQGILTAPLEIREIYQCLGVGKLDGVWYDVVHICTHDNIKVLSRLKPMDSVQRQDLTDNDRYNLNYGFSIASTVGANLLDLVKYIVGEDGSFLWNNTPSAEVDAKSIGNGWFYIVPAANHFKRQNDFIGYDHNSGNQFIDPTINSVNITDFRQNNIPTTDKTINLGMAPFTPSDFVDLAGSYLGAAIYKAGSDTVYYYVNSSQTTCIIPGSLFQRTLSGYGTYYVVGFFSDTLGQNIYSSAENFNAHLGTIRPIPGVPVKTFNFTEEVAQRYFSFAGGVSNPSTFRYVTLNLSVTNTTNSAQTINKSNIKTRLLAYNKTTGALIYTGSIGSGGYSGTQVIAANTSVSLGGIQQGTNIPYSEYRGQIEVYYPDSDGDDQRVGLINFNYPVVLTPDD